MEEDLGQNIPPPPPVENVSTPPVNKPPFGSWWKVGVLVVGGVLAASLFYAASQYSQKQPPIVTSPTRAPTPTPVSPTTSPINSPTPITNQVSQKWLRKDFVSNNQSVWNIEYPEGWETNEAGLHEGYLSLRGQYGQNSYFVVFSFPIGIDVNANVNQLVEKRLSSIPSSKRSNIKQTNITVAGYPAVKVLNIPEKNLINALTKEYTQELAHLVYIGERGDRNPSTITIYQINPNLDPQEMETMLDRIVSSIR